MKRRLFFGIALSSEVHARVVQALEELRSRPLAEGTRVSWVSPENLHVTAKFLGPVEESRVEEIVAAAHAALGGVGSVEFSLERLRLKPGLLWIDVADPSQRLTRVAHALEDAMAGLGFVSEKREYRPHVTLARIKHGRLSAEILPAGVRFGSCRASEVILYESRTLPGGAIYQAIGRIALG